MLINLQLQLYTSSILCKVESNSSPARLVRTWHSHHVVKHTITCVKGTTCAEYSNADKQIWMQAEEMMAALMTQKTENSIEPEDSIEPEVSAQAQLGSNTLRSINPNSAASSQDSQQPPSPAGMSTANPTPGGGAAVPGTSASAHQAGVEAASLTQLVTAEVVEIGQPASFVDADAHLEDVVSPLYFHVALFAKLSHILQAQACMLSSALLLVLMTILCVVHVAHLSVLLEHCVYARQSPKLPLLKMVKTCA